MVLQMAEWETDVCVGRKLRVSKLKLERMGAGMARNFGALNCTSEFIWFLDSDNWLIDSESGWDPALRAALAPRPDLVVLQRREDSRTLGHAQGVSRWNFNRECIEWNLIWRREHFLRLGGMDVLCGPGSQSFAQAGEAFDICFRHFAANWPVVSLPHLAVGHPSLTQTTSVLRDFCYAYGSSYAVSRQIRRTPSLMALFWLARNAVALCSEATALLGGGDHRRKMRVMARGLGMLDGVVRNAPRLRV